MAGPARLAVTAQRHAALGANRPQGRAVVRVRPEAGASLTGAGTVVDIVTDDMPYLVDSVTMELNRHGVDIRLIVHPLLTVHRDVTGAAHGTAATNADADAGDVPESWIHVELGPVSDHEVLGADLRRVLDDLRVAMEDQRRMRSAARDLVEMLADAGGPEEAEASELLAWLSAGHFTFLGYRRYDRAGGERQPELRAVPGTGLGILRHDTLDSFAITAAGRRPGHAPGAGARAREVVHHVDRLPAQLPGLRGGPPVQPGDGRGHRRIPVPRPVHPGRLHRVGHPHPGAQAPGRPDAGHRRGARGQP